mmetsp:Transcript_18812/g.16653  ORF Transcript_18812/g.16653 Transcript_18812/m.16653 type:complete len:157 (+) Transcript_18812:54-524(+)
MYNKFANDKNKLSSKNNSRNNLHNQSQISPLKKNKSLNLSIQKISKKSSNSLAMQAKMLIKDIRKHSSSQIQKNNSYIGNFTKTKNRRKKRRLHSYNSLSGNISQKKISQVNLTNDCLIKNKILHNLMNSKLSARPSKMVNQSVNLDLQSITKAYL